MRPTGEIIVFVTTASQDEAARIGRSVVEQELAACANIIPSITSIFRWEGKVSEEAECLMVLKSRAELFEELAGTVKRLHSYQVPEILGVSIEQGWPDYLAWVRDSTRKPKE